MIGCRVKQFLMLLGVLVLSVGVNAHPGHDHSHWSSPAIHTLLFASLAAMGALLVVVAYFRQRSKKNRNTEVK